MIGAPDKNEYVYYGMQVSPELAPIQPYASLDVQLQQQHMQLQQGSVQRVNIQKKSEAGVGQKDVGYVKAARK
jgi:hypothetical protein